MGPNFVLDKGFETTTAVEIFRAVTLTANDKVKRSDAAGQFAIGVTQEAATAQDATDGRIIGVRVLGITRAIAGAASATRGARVTVDTVGRVVVAAATNAVLGVVIGAPTSPVAGDHVDVLLTPGVVA